MSNPPNLTRIVAKEMAGHARARNAGDVAGAWRALERAHIASQPVLRPHMRVHAAMLAYAVRLRQPREIVGPLAKFVLAPLGAITGRIPWGNTGRSNVSAFQPMPIQPDLAVQLNDEAE